MPFALRSTTPALALGVALFSLSSAALAQAPEKRPDAPTSEKRPDAPTSEKRLDAPTSERPAPRPAPPERLAGAAAAPASPERAGADGERAATPRPRAYGSSAADDDVNFVVPATRRGGFLVGLVIGGQVTGAEGTPLDYDERGDAFRVSTGTTLGTASALFLGGALTDWFAFKIGFQQGAATKGDYKLTSSGLLIGAEVWPLFSRGGHWRDLSLVADFGTGVATIESRASGKELATAGAYSLIRGGVAWDALRLWKLNFGPTLAFERTTSETYAQNALWFGLRTVFYGAP